jgi:hypothetical protein
MQKNKVGISLGWRCKSASEGVQLGIRKRKNEGYLTCPFDEMVSNYQGIIKCIEDGFNFFCDTNYLEIVKKDNENLIINKYYNFMFNHESPGHADLYIHEKWAGGINHFIDNDYKEFKDRYNRRIANFKNYIEDPDNIIVFIIERYNTNNDNINDIKNALNKMYPFLQYEFYFLDLQCDPNEIKANMLYIGLDPDSEEIKRLG